MDAPTLYSMPSSGNSYKVRLLLAHLGRPARIVDCEAGSEALGTAQAAGALPMGKVPALHLSSGEVVAESNAILAYLAHGTDWFPEAPLPRAQVLAWMFFEQNRHEPVIAVRASLRTYPHRAAEATPERMAALLGAGHDVLGILESGLRGRDWLVGRGPSVADIALYAYTHGAGAKGGFDMARFPAIRDWCARMAGLSGHVPLEPAR